MKVSNELIKSVVDNKTQLTFLSGHLLATVGQFFPSLTIAEIRKALEDTLKYLDEVEGKGEI